MKRVLQFFVLLTIASYPTFAQYPEVTIRQIQQVPADSLAAADAIATFAANSTQPRWTLQASPYFGDTVCVTAQVVVPPGIITFTTGIWTMLLFDTVENASDWGGLLLRGLLEDSTQLETDGFLNVKAGDIITLVGMISEFPLSRGTSSTQIQPIAGNPINIIGAAPLPKPIVKRISDFYAGVFPTGTVQFASGEPFEAMYVEFHDVIVSNKVNISRGTFSFVDASGNELSSYDWSRYFTLGHGSSYPWPGDTTWTHTYEAIGNGTRIDTIRGFITTASGSEGPRGYRIAPIYGDDVSFEPGRLHVTVYRAEDWGQPGQLARVVLYNSMGTAIAESGANLNSEVTFDSIAPGSGYYYRVFERKSTPWGEMFVGEKTGITIVAGQTTYDTHTHNTPYCPEVLVYIDETNELLPDGGRKSIAPGTRLRLELQLKNPSYPGAIPVHAYGALHLDRDTEHPFDISSITDEKDFAVGEVSILSVLCTPTLEGEYCLTVSVFASSSRYQTSLADAAEWHNPAFRVEGGSLDISPWRNANTGISHTIIIPEGMIPTITGDPLVEGDYIGVFYDSLGVLACAGYERWSPSGNIALAAFGDDPTTFQKEGFAAGELLKWRVYRSGESLVYEAQATYAPVGGIVTNTDTYTTNGISRLASLRGGTETQCIPLRGGWSFLSSYVAPFDTSLEAIFSSVRDSLIILKNGEQKTYIPSVPVNSIGAWQKTEGYQIKVTAPQTLCIEGQKIVPWSLQISLAQGWSIMPYVRDNDLSIATALSGIVNDVVMVKDQDGRTFIPSIGVNGIGTMKVGQGYQVKMSALRGLAYPALKTEEETAPEVKTSKNSGPAESTPPWYFGNTGVTHTIIIPSTAQPNVDGVPLASGDYIGVFYDSSGNDACAGFELWTGTASIAVAAFGDDQTTQNKDGLDVGEIMKWKVWRLSDGQVYNARASYLEPGDLSGLVTDTSMFSVNGISALAGLNGSLTSVRNENFPKEFVLMQNYPNPFNPSTTLQFGLPSASHVTLTLYNALGQEIRTLVNESLDAGFHIVRLDGSGLASGVYFCRMMAGDFVVTIALHLVK